MSRISLVEAYDNRDVIGQLVRLREDVNELQNILKNIDPDGDLTNVVTKTGDQTIDGIKTFIGKIVADCDIIQNGAAYETHAEQVYSVNDYIVTRDGQITGLGPGELSGFHVKKYNGVDDSRLGVDSSGTMRVGDVGSEQPLMTRDEVADLTSGNILTWDGVNKKAITSGKAVSDLVEGSGNIGDDSHPVKVVNGVATAVSDALAKASDLPSYEVRDVTSKFTASGVTISNAQILKWGSIGVLSLSGMSVTGFTTVSDILESGENATSVGGKLYNANSATYIGESFITGSNYRIEMYGSAGTVYTTIMLMFY